MKLINLFLQFFLYINAALALPIGLSISLKARATIQQTTDTLLFVDTIKQFETARNAKKPPSLDWTSDNCTDSPDDPFGFNFVPSCQRHDFGYRNYKAQNRFTKANKDKIDSNFKKDLDNQCATYSELEKLACDGIAEIYYEAVHELGSKKKGEKEMVV